MIDLVWVLAVLVVALASAPAIAHALELPGKMRLPREAYLVVQRIYYPGFTFMGAAEPAAILLLIVLLLLTPVASADFYLVLTALLSLAAMQGVYWLVTHPVNRVWLQGQALGESGERFFAIGSTGRQGESAEWTGLRNRWEYSHVARAGLAFLGLLTLVIGIR